MPNFRLLLLIRFVDSDDALLDVLSVGLGWRRNECWCCDWLFVDLFRWFVEPEFCDWLGAGSIAIDMSYNTGSSEIIFRRRR